MADRSLSLSASGPCWRAQNLLLRRAGRCLLDRVSFELRAGELVALIGPNGAGKTSLLRAALGLLPPDAGQAWLNERPIAALTPADRARGLAYLPQQRALAWPLRVRDVVALGRFAHGVNVAALAPADHAAVEQALARCQLQALAERTCDSLSGGELARVHMARALATQAPLLVADEPVAALDPRHQLGIMQTLRDTADAGGGVLVVLHDLNLASRYADRLLWLQQGRIVCAGPPATTLTAARMAAVYGVEAQIADGQLRLIRPL